MISGMMQFVDPLFWGVPDFRTLELIPQLQNRLCAHSRASYDQPIACGKAVALDLARDIKVRILQNA
jgi:hypothetical protein